MDNQGFAAGEGIDHKRGMDGWEIEHVDNNLHGIVAATGTIGYQLDRVGTTSGIDMCRTDSLARVSITKVPKIGDGIGAGIKKSDIERSTSAQRVSCKGCMCRLIDGNGNGSGTGAATAIGNGNGISSGSYHIDVLSGQSI